MTQEDIERIIREDVKVDIYGDFYGVDRAAETIFREIEWRDRKIKDLKARIVEQSWAINPDRMGGMFTDEEIARTRNDGW